MGQEIGKGDSIKCLSLLHNGWGLNWEDLKAEPVSKIGAWNHLEAPPVIHPGAFGLDLSRGYQLEHLHVGLSVCLGCPHSMVPGF